MIASLLELQRARKALDAFCAHRNSLRVERQVDLACRQGGNKLFIGHLALTGKDNETDHFVALVRLDFVDGQWLLFWPQGDGEWQPYPHLPRVASIESVVDELERAPLHIHWE